MRTAIIVSGAYGRMGKAITEIVRHDADCVLAGLLERAGVEIFAQTDCPVSTQAKELFAQVQKAVVIDFTAPEASLATARLAVEYGHAMVIGTTGLQEEQKAELVELATKTPIFWAPNMSIGVQVLLSILPQLVQMLGEQYDVEMVELHHKHKKDSPSGTALKLAECLAAAKGWELPNVACYHREGLIGQRPKKEIGVQTIRGGDVVGVHSMYFLGQGERIEITHEAHSRETFAQGAVRVAKWLINQEKGKLYTMQDIF